MESLRSSSDRSPSVNNTSGWEDATEFQEQVPERTDELFFWIIASSAFNERFWCSDQKLRRYKEFKCNLKLR